MDADDGARDVPSLYVLAAAAALARRGAEDAAYGAFLDAVVDQNHANARGKELDAFLRPIEPVTIESPPPLRRRPPLVRQNAFRAKRGAGAKFLLPPLPRPAPAFSVVAPAPGDRPKAILEALPAALHRLFRRKTPRGLR